MGMLSTVISDFIRRQVSKRDFLRTVAVQLREAVVSIATIVWVLRERTGNLDRELLVWISEIWTMADSPLIKPESKEAVNRVINAPDEKLREFAISLKRTDKGQPFHVLRLPVLEKDVGQIQVLKRDVQVDLVLILARIEVLNGQVTMANKWHDMTFATKDENDHRALVRNIEDLFVLIERVARDLGDRICRAIAKIEGSPLPQKRRVGNGD